VAVDSSSLLGRPIGELDLPAGLMICALIRKEEILIVRSDTEIEAGDRMILFVRKEAVKKVEKLFSVRLEFF